MQTIETLTYQVDARRSVIKIRTKSQLHDIHGSGSNITGELKAAFKDGLLVEDAPVSMKIAIPVASLSSGNKARDEAMHGLIASRAFPNIDAQMAHARPVAGKPNRYQISGSVSVRGTSKPITGEVEIRERDRVVDITGSRDFDIRMWRIEMPSFLGFSVDPNVFVEIRLSCEAVGKST